MSISVRVAALAAAAGTSALLALTGCGSSTAHKPAADVSGHTSASTSVTTSPAAGAYTSPTGRTSTTDTTGAPTAHVVTPAPATAKKTTAAPRPTASCGSQMSPAGHEYMVWNPISGRTETNPKCLGLSMHNTLENLDYDLHGVNPAEAVLANQGSAASTTRENVTVAFADYGKVGNVWSVRTVTVTSAAHTLVWHLTQDGSGYLYWAVS